MAADYQARLLESERKEYQEDTFMWLYKRFGWITERINEQSEWQANETKSFVQNAAELHNRSLLATRESLIFCLAVIVMIALASAGLWIGVVALFLVLQRRWSWYVLKQGFRLDNFRERFRELEKATSSEMLAEDKELLRKCAESILFPLAVADHRRGRVSPGDLEHVETLYREYCNLYDPHRAYLDPYLESQKEHVENCGLCAGARRVREHIEDVLSKFEAAIESARQTLITQIDRSNAQGAVRAKDFLEDFREWERWHHPPEAQQDEKLRSFPLLKSLRDKECWTFEEAATVRELCDRARAAGLFDKLSREMEGAAARCGLEQVWKLYAWKYWLLQVGSTSSPIRRIIGRHNAVAVFREFIYPSYEGLSKVVQQLTYLKNFGFDVSVVLREVERARKLLAKERWEKAYGKELAAAQAFAQAEELVQERRRKEWLRIELRPEKPLLPLAFRWGRAARRFIRKLS